MRVQASFFDSLRFNEDAEKSESAPADLQLSLALLSLHSLGQLVTIMDQEVEFRQQVIIKRGIINICIPPGSPALESRRQIVCLSVLLCTVKGRWSRSFMKRRFQVRSVDRRIGGIQQFPGLIIFGTVYVHLMMALGGAGKTGSWWHRAILTFQEQRSMPGKVQER